MILYFEDKGGGNYPENEMPGQAVPEANL